METVFKYTPSWRNVDFVNKSKVKSRDKIRIPNKKGTFLNKYRNIWSREINVINRVNTNTSPITYNTKDFYNDEKIKGSFYKYEFKKITL